MRASIFKFYIVCLNLRSSNSNDIFNFKDYKYEAVENYQNYLLVSSFW